MKIYLTRLILPDDPAYCSEARSEGAHRLLAWALANEGYDPAVLILCRTSEGKPYLQWAAEMATVNVPAAASCGADTFGADPLCPLPGITLAHSGSWALCALSDRPGIAIGADLERVRPVSPRLWSRYLATYAGEPMGDAYTAILRWTRLEAALKREGSAPAVLTTEDAFTTLTALPGYLLTVIGEAVTAPICFVSRDALRQWKPL